MTSASKVGDLFTTAGEAFSQLSEIAHLIQANNSNINDENERGWTAEDTESLRLAVRKFGDDLNIISERIKDKAMYQIKFAFRKLQPALSNTGKTSEELANMTVSNQNTTPQPIHPNDDSYSHRNNESVSSSMIMSPTEERTNTIVSSAQGSTVASSSLTLPGASAASICSSPSPFLHYPLLRRGADITLNMLNAGDDSDDDDRMTRSVFNSA